MEIPGYMIERELGKSGATTVYLATQERLNRQVALKVIKPMLGEDDQFAARFIKEGHIVLQLKHPQIVALYDFNAHGRYYYFSMEFLPGGSLAQRISEKLTVQEAVNIAILIAKALAYAHQKGIIHRNIKPKNILFRQDGTPVLSDFSIAKVLDADATQLTTIGMMIENPVYMSPERLEGKALDARSDLYSLGIVFYEMLTQQLPHQATDLFLPKNFIEFQDIFDRLLARNPESRFENAEQFIAAIGQIKINQHSSSPLLALGISKTLDQLTSRTIPIIPPIPIVAKESADEPKYSKAVLIVSSLFTFATTLTVSGYLFITHQSLQPDTKINVQSPSNLEARSAIAIHYEKLAAEPLKNGEWEKSLEIIQLGLNAAPNDRQLLALYEQIQKNQKASYFLVQAREFQQRGMLEESQRAIEEGLRWVPDRSDLLESRDQIEVDAKLEQIVSQYAGLAKDALDQEDFKKVEEYLAQLAQIKADHPKLLDLRKDLQKKQDQIAAVRRQTEEANHRQTLEESRQRIESEAKRRAEQEAKQRAAEEAKRKAIERAHRPDIEEPKRQTAASEIADGVRRRCGNILSRLTLGEPVSDGDRTFLTQRCR